jgi:hypothetical protein
MQRSQQHAWRLQPLAGVAPPLSEAQEGRLVRAWRRLPGALLCQVRELDLELQAEGHEGEAARWAALPHAVQARGAAWWV